ncbi:MAG TPA: methanogen output domain 1-containing protein [Stellaceae bacterium]|nr:methanogen output domain 1-containing protein [Stellaceae bacterium]
MVNEGVVTVDEKAAAEIGLDRDLFLRVMLRELAGTLQDVVGMEEASGYISVVGAAIGEELNRRYKAAFRLKSLTRPQVSSVLVDLKHRIQGDFFVIEENEDKIVFGNRQCPFGDKVRDRPSMCMLTSNVFGYIAAANLGYAKVELQETIAAGHEGCRVVIYLRDTEESAMAEGREYVRPFEAT